MPLTLCHAQNTWIIIFLAVPDPPQNDQSGEGQTVGDRGTSIYPTLILMFRPLSGPPKDKPGRH